MGSAYAGKDWGEHGWLQAYGPNSGWIDIDPTYGEAGVVDGTHIVMSIVPDPNKATDLIMFPGTVDANLGQKQIKVELIESKNFSKMLEIKAAPSEEITKQWFDLNFSIKNLSNGFAFAPVLMSIPGGFEWEAKDRIFLLRPNEEKQINNQVLANFSFGENQYITAEYVIISFAEQKRAELKIMRNPLDKILSKIKVSEIVPLIKEKKFVIEIALENTGTEAMEVGFNVTGKNLDLNKNETIGALEKKRFLVTIEDYSLEPYNLKITGKNLFFEKKIVPKDRLPKPVATDQNNKKQSIVEDIAPEPFGISGELMIILGIIFASMAIVLAIRPVLLKKQGF